MVSKNQIKLIASLHQKKYRDQYGLFIAEGFKVIDELLQSDFELQGLYQTESLFGAIGTVEPTFITSAELKKMSALTSPNNCLAVFKIAPQKIPNYEGLIVALDEVRDPGNLGTIIRLCDWFGVTQLVCSLQSADCYNPKVVQATMGSLKRVNVSYVDLESFLAKSSLPVLGTFMNGANVYQSTLPLQAIVVMGNEANGIRPEIEKHLTQRLAIPRFGTQQETESLNVASATAIILSEFRRGN